MLRLLLMPFSLSLSLSFSKLPQNRPWPTSSAPLWARARCSRCSWTRLEVRRRLWRWRKRRESEGPLAIEFSAVVRFTRPSSCLNPYPPPKKNETTSKPNPGIVLTNDGNAILREIDVSHPAAKVRAEKRERERERVFPSTACLLLFLLPLFPFSLSPLPRCLFFSKNIFLHFFHTCVAKRLTADIFVVRLLVF